MLIALSCLACDSGSAPADAAVSDLPDLGVRSLASVLDAYGRAWREPDDAKRLALLEASFLPDGTYSDSGPNDHASSREALSAKIKESNALFPGSSITVTTGVDAHHAVVRYGWVFKRADGVTLIVGEDFLTLAADGRIARATGFYPDPSAIGGPPEPAVIGFAAAWGSSADLNATVTETVSFVARDAQLAGKAALTAHLATRGGQLRTANEMNKHDGFVRANYTLADTDGGTAAGVGQLVGHLAADGKLDEIILFDGEIPSL
jgi:hypothetical protein